jgi:hypothetical protein
MPACGTIFIGYECINPGSGQPMFMILTTIFLAEKLTWVYHAILRDPARKKIGVPCPYPCVSISKLRNSQDPTRPALHVNRLHAPTKAMLRVSETHGPWHIIWVGDVATRDNAALQTRCQT